MDLAVEIQFLEVFIKFLIFQKAILNLLQYCKSFSSSNGDKIHILVKSISENKSCNGAPS